MDDESGDDERDGLTSGRRGESRQDWWSWRNESGSWFQRRGDAYLNERSIIIYDEMVGGRERVTTQYSCIGLGWAHINSMCNSMLQEPLTLYT